jgi:uncharacterized integral membrane protein (TIGR00697 family)
MNELIFFIQVIFLMLATLSALRIGSSALVSLICIEAILANLFVTKQITLFGLTATASDSYVVGSIIALNLLQEFFGKKIALTTIGLSFCSMVFYTVLSYLHLLYMAAPSDYMHAHFCALLTIMPRIAIASISVYVLVQLFDRWFYGFLSKIWGNRSLVLLNIISVSICQLLDTVLFSFLGLYGIVSNIWQIILISYSIKLITLLIAAPFISLAKKVIP